MLLRAETSYKFALCNFIALIAASRQGDRREYRAKSLRFSFHSTRMLLLLSSVLCLALSGCIADVVNASDLKTLLVSAKSVDLGNVSVGSSASASVSLTNGNSVPVKITQVSLTGQSFSIAGQSSLPVSVAAGGTYSLNVNFDPAAVGTATSQVTITSDASASTTLISLSGTGVAEDQSAVQLSAVSCSSASITGSGTDACTVTISGAAPVGGFNVNLSSNNAAVSVPATVTVMASATTAQFTANVLPVSTAQAVNLSASAGSVSKSLVLQLSAAEPTLSLNAASLAFGNVLVDTAVTQSVTMTSTGALPVVISSATLAGPGFTMTGVKFPLTLSPGQTATFAVQFDPTAAGAATGQLAITSNSSTGNSTLISLGGTGEGPAVSNLYCSSAGVTGAATETCDLVLNSPSASGAMSVSVTSSNPAVTVPATVMIPANSNRTQFTANVASVLTAQAATLSATAPGTASVTYGIQLSPYISTLQINTANLAFGSVPLNTTATQSLTLASTGSKPLTVNAVTLTGAGFTVSGATFPITLNPGQKIPLTVQFDPAVAGAATGQLTITSNSSTGNTAVINLSGFGGGPAVSNLYCSSAGVTGAVTETCDLVLNSASASGAVSVNVTSNDAAVTVPATVVIPVNSNRTQFTANVASVLTTQAVTLTATAPGTAPVTYGIQLSPYISTMQINTANLAFAAVPLNSAATQSITLASTGSKPLTVNAVTLTGAGFTVSGATFPITFTPGQKIPLTVQFDPTVAGAATGQLTITSNSSTGNTAVINLSGFGGGPAVSNFYCTSASVTGAATETCNVKLSSTLASGPISVSLSSSNAAVTLPATVTIPANATATVFTASVASVLTAQAVILTANVPGSASITYTIQLSPYILTLTPSRNSIAFQDVTVNTTPTQSVALTSTGTEPVTITTIGLTGSNFALSGITFPLTLNPNQSALLSVQFHPTAAGLTTGQITIESNSSLGGTSVISLNGAAVSSSGRTGTPNSFAYDESPLLNTLIPPNPSAAISSNFFGMTIYYLQPSLPGVTTGLTPFPALPVSTMRLWDVAYWSFMEASPGQFNWFKMDGIVTQAQQNGVNDFIFTFGHLPLWAALDPTAPCTNGEGIGTCSPPDMSAFDNFATQVVQRYCGKVKDYEPWNEPSNPAFWSGTNSQLLTISQHLYQIAKDPANCGCTNGVCSPNGGVNPNKVLLPPINDLSAIPWLDSYLTAAGAQYPYADVATFHGYGFTNPEDMPGYIQSLKETLAAHGLSNLELWNTEASWEWDTNFSVQQQASWLMRYHIVQNVMGESRLIWYAYDDCTWGTLWTSTLCTSSESPAGQLTEAGTAYGTIENWFIGANLTHCQQYQNGLWACELQRSGGYDAWMLWSSTGASLSVSVPANLNLTVYRDWQNNLNSLPTQLTVDQMPVLLENQDL